MAPVTSLIPIDSNGLTGHPLCIFEHRTIPERSTLNCISTIRKETMVGILRKRSVHEFLGSNAQEENELVQGLSKKVA